MEERLIKARWTLLAIVVVVTATLTPPARNLTYDQSIESFFSPQNPLLQSYLISRAAYGGDEFLIVGYPESDPTSEESLKEIRQFSERLSAVPGIRPESTQDLEATLRNDRATGLLRVAMRLKAVEDAILGLARRMLLSDDDSTVAILLRLENESDAPVPRAETFAQVRELAFAHSPDTAVAGEPLQVFDMFQYVEQDAFTLGLVSSVLLMLVILLFFRNLRWVLLPLIVIQVTLIWTMGGLALMNMKLSMVSSVLNSLVTIIAIATVMHIALAYRKNRSSLDRPAALRETIRQMKRPVFWTCATTAVGFASLFCSSIVPVRSFALMMTLASLLVGVVSLLILPGGVLIGRAQPDLHSPWGETHVMASLRKIGIWSNRHGIAVAILFCGIGLVASWGLTRLQVETDFSKNFRDDSPIVKSLEFFETRMGGVGSWEIGFSAPEELSEEFVDKIRRVAKQLRELQLEDGTSLTKVIAITDGLDLVPKVRVSNEDRGPFLSVIPRLRVPTLQEKQQFLTQLQPEMTPSLYRPDQHRMRILLRSLEQRPADVKLRLIAEVERTTRETFPDATATGLYVLLANLVSSLLSDQLLSCLIAITGITMMMAVAFRSLLLGVISIIPNLLPILLLIGTMGWLGIPINIGTAMIASVSMGLTVDATIHYLTTYQRHRHRGGDHQYAVAEAHSETGLAMLLSTLALVLGFSVLTLSHFVPLADFGILVSVAMLGGLVCNLFLLPVLLKLSSSANTQAMMPETLETGTPLMTEVAPQ